MWYGSIPAWISKQGYYTEIAYLERWDFKSMSFHRSYLSTLSSEHWYMASLSTICLSVGNPLDPVWRSFTTTWSIARRYYLCQISIIRISVNSLFLSHRIRLVRSVLWWILEHLQPGRAANVPEDCDWSPRLPKVAWKSYRKTLQSESIGISAIGDDLSCWTTRARKWCDSWIDFPK